MLCGAEFHELFDWAPIPLLEMDAAGNIQLANRAACDLFGYSPPEFRNRTIFDLDPFGNFRGKLAATPAPKPFHFQFESGTGDNLSATVHLARVPESGEGEYRFRAAFIVLTAQENEQLAELDLYRVRWETILKQLPGGVLIADAHGRVVLTNDWMQKLMKRPLPDFGNDTPDREMEGWRAVDGSPYPVSRWPPLRCLRTGRAVIGEEMIFDLDHHTRTHLKVSASPIRDRNDRLIAVGCVFFDVTAQRLTEHSFRLSEARYRDIFEQDLAANLIFTHRLNLLACNSAAVSLFAYNSKKEMFASSAAGHFPGGADRRAILERTTSQAGLAQNSYMRMHRRNGSPILAFGTVRPVRDKSGKLIEIHCHFADVTERRRAERKISSLSAQLLQVQNEERRKLSQDLHDSTGQNLSALAMNLALIRGCMNGDPEKAALYLSECEEIVQNCVRDIRSISYTLHPPLLNELGLAAALKWFIEGFSGRSGIQIELDVMEELGRLGNLIEITLFRIVQQALSNVHRHSGSATASVRLSRDAEGLTLLVSDEGCGFTSSAEGVGLASIRQQLSFIHGVLEIISENGATLKATIPVKTLQNF